jgi:hypothetical protein
MAKGNSKPAEGAERMEKPVKANGKPNHDGEMKARNLKASVELHDRVFIFRHEKSQQ